MTIRRTSWLAVVGVVLLTVGAGRAADPDPVKADEKLFQDAKLGVDGPALLDFFKKRTLGEVDRGRVLDLIRKLGSDEFEEREQATVDLTTWGPSAASLLRQAANNSEDVEVIRRCERCLELIDRESRLELAAAAARLLAVRKPDGASTVLLAYLPFTGDDTCAVEVRAALVALAMPDGKPDAALTAALDDKDALRRSASVQALIRAGKPEQRQSLVKFLQDPDPQVRLHAALAFLDVHDKCSVPVLVALLTELPLEQGYIVEETLCHLAGDESPSVSLTKDEAAQKKCKAAWQAWWAKHGEKLDLTKIDQQNRTLGFALITDQGRLANNGRVVELDREGKPRWSIENLARPVDAVVMAADRVAIAEYTAKRVTVRDFKGTVIWEKTMPTFLSGLQRLANGNLLVVVRNQVVELDKEGKEVSTYNRGVADIFSACKLRNGELVVVTRTGLCLRLDKDGKEVKSFNVGGPINVVYGSIDALPNGRVLVPLPSQSKVVEYDTDGKLIWEAAFPNPSAAFRLPNGHTLVTSYTGNRAAELDRDGKEVWSHASDGGRLLRVRKR